MSETNSNSASKKAYELVLGAGESIDLIAYKDFGFPNTYPQVTAEDVIALADERLRKRCILASPDRIISSEAQLRSEMYTSERPVVTKERGWTIRHVKYVPSGHCLIVDNYYALISPVLYGSKKDSPLILLEGGSEIGPLIDHFERLWSSSVDVVYEDIISSSAPSETQKIIAASEETWHQLIEYLSRNPEQLYSLSPRKFEELVAELLLRDGMQVQLTPPTKDGGRDILAFSETSLGKHLYYVECKRYSKSNPVGVSLVRALYGVIEADKATAGLLVTTSYFTKGAISFRESIKHRLSLKDYDNLALWLKSNRR